MTSRRKPDHVANLVATLRLLGLPEPRWGAKSHGQPGELVFAPDVKGWRFDLAWEDRKVAVEVEGVSVGISRHTTIAGYREDARKYSEAAIRGWLVVRATQDMVPSGEAIDLVLRAWKSREPQGVTP